VWWSTLLSSLPSFSGPLSPGEYHIKLGNIPMSFSVDEGWYSDLDKTMPNSFSITLTGEATAGSIITFYRGHSVIDLDKFRSVIDPDKPREIATAVVAERNLSRWFLEHCRAYLEVGKPEDVQPPIGGAPGIQFEASILPSEGIRTVPGLYAPAIPIFPVGVPRADPFYLVEGDKGLIIVLSVAGEPMTIIVTSPESEFEDFREKARNVLDTVEWLSLEPLEEA